MGFLRLMFYGRSPELYIGAASKNNRVKCGVPVVFKYDYGNITTPQTNKLSPQTRQCQWEPGTCEGISAPIGKWAERTLSSCFVSAFWAC